MNQPNSAEYPASALGLTRKEVGQWSLARVIAATEADPITASGAGFEVACSRAIAQALGREPERGLLFVPLEVLTRDLQAATSGGYIVGTTTQAGGSFATALYGASVVERLGIERIGPLRESVTLPRTSAAPGVTWLAGEGSQITNAQPTLGSVAGTPKTAGAFVTISGQLMRQMPAPIFDAFVFGELARSLAAGVDAAVIAGSGASGQPLGLVNTTGVYSQSGASLSFAGIAAMVEAVELAGLSDPARAGFAMGATVGKLLRQRDRAASGGSGAIFVGGEIDGFRAVSTTNAPDATLVFADWSRIKLLEWGTLEVGADPFSLFQSGRVQVRALWSVDVIVQHAGAIAVATSVT